MSDKIAEAQAAQFAQIFGPAGVRDNLAREITDMVMTNGFSMTESGAEFEPRVVYEFTKKILAKAHVGENDVSLAMVVAETKDRCNRAYSERAAAAVALARAAIALGWEAGIGTDTSAESVEWSRVLYVDTPNGQVSWHIAPDDQHLLEGLPEYPGEWNGTYLSREAGSPWAKWGV